VAASDFGGKPRPQALADSSSNVKTIPNPPLPAEGSGAFSNYHLAAIDILVPWFIQRCLPFGRSSWYVYFFLVIVLFVPLTIGYWILTSRYGPRINEKVALPNRPLSDYYTITDEEFRAKWDGKKMPMQIWHDAYFDGKIELAPGVSMLDALEYRYDWSRFELSFTNFRYVLFNLIPDVIFHTAKQDDDQIKDTYDRGNDFYSWFLGPRMIYTGGVISDINREETLEELQDNKLNLVCSKLDLKPTDRLLDIGCGWGTLLAHAAKNYGCEVTGVTAAANGAEWANRRLRESGIPESQGRALCMDYRQIPKDQKFTKITCLEMAEHVGIRRYGAFLKDLYNLLEDDGILVFQVAGLRKTWQFEDLIWGLFMNTYVFPGADASLNQGWVINQLEGAGFEVKSSDVFGVHYSATIHRWYKNWINNREKVEAKYGPRWYRIWLYFLAYSTIVARQGGSSVFQITLHKNLNGFHRVEGIPSHPAIQALNGTKAIPSFTPVETHKEWFPEIYGAQASAPAAVPAAAPTA
jgi:cyclopropane fatty-acyl-phospholipid synthase-like methyltransferase